MTPSKIQMDQIRSTSATDTGENIRAGSQKKSSLSPAEGLQGASPDATCTCPSGGGSLRNPCPAHPASVELAGGDERDLQGAQEERDGWGRRYGDDGTIVDDWKALKTIQCAALARVAELTATRNRYGLDAHYFNKNLQRILRDFGSFTPDELARSLIILAKVADEKVVAQAQQLHDLDKQCRDDVARALGLRPSQERGFAWSHLLASIKSCVKAAEAQHSVPEGWMLVECGIWTQEQVDEMQKTVARFRSSEFVDDRALAMAVADAGQCKAPEISLADLLAAAPGKEGV
ncbi:hypothetical protein [Pseudomonas aeruginosa]|uniref:hypothetical protein n=1 Tax=Pseudomonas aeruginosa TaxID=287 RepID=UPI003857468E